MDTAGPSTVGVKPRLTWKVKEVAFVVNFVDFCVKNRKDFKTTVVGEFSKFAKREFTMIAIENKIRRMLTEYCNVKYAEFIKKGTQSLDVQALPGEVLDAMRSQRKLWGLDELSTANKSDVSATQGNSAGSGETTGAMQPKRKASTLSNAESGKSYRETSVSDSEATSSEQTQDPDFDAQPAKKKRKLNPPAPKQRSSKRQGSTAPTSTLRVHSHQAQPQSDAHLPTTTKPVKRKIDAAEIVDLGSVSPPPIKRQVVESAVEGSPVASRLPAVDSTSPRPLSPRTIARSAFQIPHPNRVLGQAKDAVSNGYTRVDPPLKQKAGAVPVQDKSTPSADEKKTLGMIQDLGNLIAVYMREQKLGSGMTTELEDRLRCIRKTVERHPGQLLDKMLADIESADLVNARMRAMLHDLVGRRDFDTQKTFPHTSQTHDINKAWGKIRDKVQMSFDIRDYPSEPAPRPEDAGYVAARIDDLSKNASTPETESPKQFLEEFVSRLDSPHVAQSIIAALLCHWIFAGPEPMCHDVYSSKETKLYEALLATNGPAEVQHFDKIGMKRLFEDEDFQRSYLNRRAYKLLADLEIAQKMAWPDAPGFRAFGSGQDWAEKALNLKQTLMINSNEYRIHYCMPGTTFDPTWMRAEDVEGLSLKDGEVQMKKVAACLFPALSQHDPAPFEEGPSLESVLVKNKKFFPSLAEKREFDPETVIAKAVVLVL